MQEDQKSNFEELAINFLSGEISSTEISRLAGLLKETENQQQFREIKEAWNASSLYQAGAKHLRTNASWERVNANIEHKPQIKRNWAISPLRILKIAALWLLLFSVGSMATLLIMNKKQHRPNGTCEISTPLGSRSHTLLPDGSEVWLNAGTTLRYPESFSANQRDVFLTGEAYFKVKSNKKWPFVVHTKEVKIRALGTAFNVKAYPTDKAVVTTLVEGVIKLENEVTGEKTFTYTLKPKEKLTFFKDPEHISGTTKTSTPDPADAITAETQNNIEVKENINTVLSTSWKDSRWVVDGERLDNLAVSLERRYGVKINLLSVELSQYKFTGTIENETLEQVLKYLKLTTPIKYIVQKGYVDLSINEALKENYTNYLKKTN
jgi:transmembrane sensor